MELNTRLSTIFIKRTKEDVLGSILPSKDEFVVFCPLSELQKTIYKHLLDLPDVALVRNAHGPCECGINRKYFEEYQRLSTKEQKIEYLRRNEFVARSNCCRNRPKRSELER